MFILAQTYWKQSSQSEDLVVYVLLGAALLAIAIALVVRARRAAALAGTIYDRAAFRRAARGAGLAEEEVRFLEGYGKALNVTNPDFLFRNPEKLDSFFKTVFRRIESDSSSEAEAEANRALLFEARERLTRSQSSGMQVSSTRQLGRGIPLTFIAPGEESYPTIVARVEPEGIGVEAVRDAYGEVVRFRRGSKLSCFFYSQAHQGHQFATRVIGWQRSGIDEIMVIAHSDAVSALPTRSHARRETKVPCAFFQVAVTESVVKGKKRKEAKVQGISFPGTIIDLSAGGLAIQSANALAAGEYLKVEFEPGGQTQAAFGKVVRMNKLKNVGGVMHVQFVRISQRSLNAILSYVYGYAE